MTTLFRILLLLTLAFILKSCAQMKPPTGGPKDETPPKVLVAVPANFSTLFNANRIVLEFDEFVQLRNLSSQLVINPAMEEKPDFRLKGKKLIIDLNSPLQDETTYVINFGDAVVDLTEGNEAEALQYVFSTGPFLDSLRFRGEVIEAFEKTPASETLVMLYSNPSDTMVFKGTPDYFAKTDKQGKFQIDYIRPGEYRAIALKDENSNYRYNPPGESIGFLDSLITPGQPDSSNIPVKFLLFQEVDSTQYIDEKISRYYGQYQFTLFQPSDSVSVSPLDERFELHTETSVLGDTVTTWFLNRADFPELESLELEVFAQPEMRDTLTWRLSRGKNEEDGQMKIKDNLLYNFNPANPMRFAFNHPVARVDTLRIELYRDSVPVEFEWTSSDSLRKFELHHDWEQGETYRIFVPDSTFWDVFELTNDTLDKNVTMREDRYYGNLQFDFTFDESESIILEMLNDRGAVIKEIVPEESGVLRFEKMNPGSYKMRVIYDLNENGEWDTGNFKEGKQPEPIEIYPSTIQIRSNWDMEMEWDIRDDAIEGEKEE